ncbi:MAG: acyltransferase [Pseudomonadota bacterium]
MDRTVTLPATTPPETQTLQSVQVLRAVAAIAVAWFHIAPHLAGHLQGSIVGPLLKAGDAGVDVFFVISGFIIWLSSERATAPGAFLYRRLTRIFITLWPAVLIFVAAIMLQGLKLPPAEDLMRSITLVDPAPMDVRHGLYVTWSLTYEVLFYICFAGLIVVGRQHALLAGAAVVAFIETARLLQTPTELHETSLLTSHRHYEFLMGCAAAYWMDRIGAARWQAAALAMGAALVALGLYEDLTHGTVNSVFRYGLGTALVLVAVPLLEPLCRNRVGAALGKVGDWSYAFYLLHPTVKLFMGLHVLWIWMPAPAYVAMTLAVYTALSLLAAALFHRWIEQPLLRLSREYAPGKPQKKWPPMRAAS